MKIVQIREKIAFNFLGKLQYVLEKSSTTYYIAVVIYYTICQNYKCRIKIRTAYMQSI